MVVKVLISGLSASKEIKKHQQRAQMLLDSLRVAYEAIDITEPGHEAEKELMKTCKKRNNNAIALPPQFFNDDRYCGDYEDFSMASDEDTVFGFLGLEEDITIENGDIDAQPSSTSEGMSQSNAITSATHIVNGDHNDTHKDVVMDELVSQVTTVEEVLTLDGQRIDIPVDKIFELKGKKLDLNELLFTKTQSIGDTLKVVDPKSDDTNEDHNKDITDSSVDNSNVEPSVDRTDGSDDKNDVKSNDSEEEDSEEDSEESDEN